MSLLDRLKNQKAKPKNSKTIKDGMAPLSLNTWKVRTYDKNVLQMDVTLACIDAIAKNVAKIKLSAVQKEDGLTTLQDSEISQVLRHPNAYMTAYDFLYKVTALLLASDNVFIYPEYDESGHLLNLWPINYESFTLLHGQDGRLYASFRLNYFRTYTAPYESLIHLRQHYIGDDLFGESNDAIKPVCSLIETQNEGIINGIKNSAIIRGILKATGVLKRQDLENARDNFIKDNLQASNNGGVMVLDGRFDYKSLDSKPYVIDAETMKEAKQKVLDYFHISEAFLSSAYTPDQYEAVYEGVLEPLAMVITQALTAKLYTATERAHGYEIEAAMDSVKYQPMATVVSIIQATSQLGLFTRDEYREMLGYTPLGHEQGGDEIMVAVNNYTTADTATEAQKGANSNDEDKNEE